MIIYSHRGLDLDRPSAPRESTFAAFQLAADSGHGVELDLQILKSGELIVAHDADTARWSGGLEKRRWLDLSGAELAELEIRFGSICRLAQVLELAGRTGGMHLALHLKSANHNAGFLEAVAAQLTPYLRLQARLLIFDLNIDAATRLRADLPEVGLAPSVAHAHDITRFQKLTGGTLMSPADVLCHRSVFNWVWLDEWDRKGADGKTKALYAAEWMQSLHAAGFAIALISPELHKNEHHEDGQDLQKLELRWREILRLKPHAVCTDYPARFSKVFAGG